MQSLFSSDFKVGVLGGGQLGKMMALAAQNWDLNIWCLDTSKTFPAGTACTNFVEGNFKNYEDVYNFGKTMDVLTIEIEHVNTDALVQLEKEGIKIHPKPSALNIIKDKGLQKQFYEKQNIPTSPFQLFESATAIRNALNNASLSFPFVQKSRTAGYDGKGVAVIKNEDDLSKLIEAPSMVEDLVDIELEFALVAARNENGEIATFPAVDMEFNPIANLVEYLICPSNIPEKYIKQAEEISKTVIEKLDICGLLAVEWFYTKSGEVLVNEVAPRPHNSGHHTIDSCQTSQFQQHLRGILNLPLGSTEMKMPSIMVNLLGEAGHTGPVFLEGIDECMRTEGVNLHMYGKKITKPFRKMGHATIVDRDINKAKEKAKFVKDTLKIVSR